AGDADHRGNADDAAETLPHHPAHRGPREAEGRRQIDCNDLVPVLVSQLNQEVVLGDSRVGHQNIELAHGFLALRHQGLDLVLVRTVPRQHGDAVLKLAGELIERVAARTGERDGRALPVKRARDCPSDSAGRSGNERGPAGQIEHRSLPRNHALVSPNIAMSSGVPIETPRAPSTMRLTRPLNTLPAPTSSNVVTPAAAMNATDSRQRTVPVTCATSARTMSGGSLTGLTSTLATTGTTGRFIATVASAAAIASAAGCISAQWKGAETGSIMARRAPFSFAIPTAPGTPPPAPPNCRSRPGKFGLARPPPRPLPPDRSRDQAMPPWRRYQPAPLSASPDRGCAGAARCRQW